MNVVCSLKSSQLDLVFAGISLTHQSSATHMAFGGASAAEGSPVLLSTGEEYPEHMGADAQLLRHSAQEDLGGVIMLNPHYQVGHRH